MVPARARETRSAPAIVTRRPTIVFITAATIGTNRVSRFVSPETRADARDVLLIPDSRTKSAVGPRTLGPVADAFRPAARIRLGLPVRHDDGLTRRWRAFSAANGLEVDLLGSCGWDRVVFEGHSTVLRHVDIPVQVADTDCVVALAVARGDRGCLAMWRDVVHQRTGLLAGLDARAIAELSLAFDATYVLSASIGATRMMATTDDRIAAELIATGMAQIVEERHGYELPGPWESPIVQHLSDLSAGVTLASDLVLRVAVDDNAKGVVERIAERLNCRLETLDQAGGARD